MKRVDSTMKRQTTDTVLMVRPVAFACNEETIMSNAFQVKGEESTIPEIALAEFDAYSELLRENGVRVIPVEDTKEPHTPDSVFPNNWFSTHEDGTLVIYPMCAENRRQERKKAALKAIETSFRPKRTVDLTPYEAKGLFLEGTGSLVLDRVNRIAYACRSVRTSEAVLQDFCGQLGYSPLVFDAADEKGRPVYHTNVMLSVGTDVAVVCLDSIRDSEQKKKLSESLNKSGKTIMEISLAQMHQFAGNMLEVRNDKGEACLVLSQTAYDCLTKAQVEFFAARFKLIVPDIKCIEQNGGGSARCMLAEIF